jgi:hypothetical protein
VRCSISKPTSAAKLEPLHTENETSGNTEFSQPYPFVDALLEIDKFGRNFSCLPLYEHFSHTNTSQSRNFVTSQCPKILCEISSSFIPDDGGSTYL